MAKRASAKERAFIKWIVGTPLPRSHVAGMAWLSKMKSHRNHGRHAAAINDMLVAFGVAVVKARFAAESADLARKKAAG